MASSNRHWPSLFKSKPACSSSPHQWQHDHHPTNHSSLLSSSHCHKPNSYASGSEERTPEPKPRWNPKPEQIRILEGIFNSGMVNPPREEIRRIRSQLQAYGQVGDANVFYWFQNRKSRSKHKQRHLKPPPPNPAAAAPCSSSPTSSSDVSPSSGSNKRRMILLPPGSGISSATPFELAEAQALFRGPPPPPDELGLEFLAAIPPDGIVGGSNEEAEIWGDIIAHEIGISNSISPGSINMTEVAPPPLIVLPASVNAMISTVDHTPSPVNEIQQAARSTVFINDVAYEVMAGPLNIREAFGGAAVLLHSSGQPVLTDEWGLTLHPLQHGASYYLVQ